MTAAGFIFRDRPTVRSTALVVTVSPATEPVTLNLVKQHLRVDTDDTDELLTMQLTVARMMVEQYLGRVLVTQTLAWTIQEMDPRRVEALLRMPTTLELPRSPVQSVSTVTVRDAAGTDSVLDTGLYTLDAAITPAKLRFDWNAVEGQVQHLQIVFVAGYGAADAVPMSIRQAILVTIAHLYEHRGDANEQLPRTAEWLCDPYRVHSFGS